MIIINIFQCLKMQSQVEQKQQFLRVQILESGYDPQQFIEFLSSYASEQNPNIQEYSMNQIRKIVGAFKKSNAQKQNSTANNDSQSVYSNKSIPTDINKNVQPDNTERLVEQKKVRVEYQKYAPLYDFEIKGTMPCVEADRLVKQQLTITVPDMESKQIQGYLFGIGSKTEYYYHVKTNLMKGPVKRLSEDFDWLNNTLARLYPFLALPELQPVRKDHKDPYIQRKKDIQEYLQYIAKKQFFLSTHVFMDFLTIGSDKVQKYKKSYDSMGFAKGVSLLKFPSGSVDIELSHKSRQFYHNSKQFCRKTTKIHETLTQSIEKMIQSYRVAVQDTYTVVDLYAQLYDLYNDLNNKFPTFKKQDYGDCLVNLNNLFVGVGDSLKNTADILQKFGKDYYRFTIGYDKNLLKLVKTVKQSENQYLDYKYNLHRKKERVISDPSKWQLDSNRGDIKKLSRDELMRVILPKQTLSESQLKNWYAFSLKNQQRQFVEYLNLTTHRYYKVYKNMAKQLLISDKGYLEALTKFIGQCRRGGQ